MPLCLAAVEYGAGPPIAVLHGLFGSGRNWATIARRLAAKHRVVALDLRNHGNSPWADTMTYREMAEDVLFTLRALGIGRCALLGHSMGGKAAMVAALWNGGEIERLVIVDIAPVRYEPRHMSLVRAMRALDLSRIRRRSEADGALAAAVPDPAERGFLLQNLVLDDGRARWRLNLAAIEYAMPDLVDFPVMPAGIDYRGPALFVAGGRSDYLLPAHEPTIARRFPGAQIARIGDAGHWLHAERPQSFFDVVEPFFAIHG
ncbi:MAG TPA: alpha/beta fold hydrolase [Stellaceae bacterium]|nr:alpha/beta fold hydrolase [Stellaceae bacterium]